MKAIISALALIIITTGCTVSPPLTRDGLLVTAPDRYNLPSPGPEAGPEWWTAFESPGMNQAIEAALEHNRDLVAAAARVEQAAAAARIAGANLKPSVSAGLSGSRRKQNFIGFPIPGADGDILSSTSTNLGVSLDISWEVDLWGRMKAGARAAVSELKAAEADLAGARLSIAGQTAKAWLALAEAVQQVDLAKQTVASFRESESIVRHRYENGLAPSLDLRLQKTNLANAEAFLANRRIGLELSARQLEVLMGRYPGGETEDGASLPEPPQTIPGGLPADLVSRRPDLVAAEFRLNAAGYRFDSARRSLYPRLVLTGSGGSSSQEFKDLLDGDFSVWSLAAGLTQPLFQGGRLRAGVDQARSASDEILARYAGAVLGAYLEVETALASEQHLAARQAALAEASRQSTAARLLAEDRYRSGLTPFITVLESQRQSVQSESDLITARQQLLNNRIDLVLALGGGYRQEIEP
ncbi:MAG: efflux transporter outer membrane subunit [Acidobacteria bacterium]|uniref:Efflux transporter outer membrane subunit n=1 Tax=Candidatus Polarisedimenticola svalbardensis TaxID=2886004 RepID=A0A8J6XWU0_9BACT|nr:efflux transporter outer membrane subunit [Candidatus Polarisedimenticola svalbardensis]